MLSSTCLKLVFFDTYYIVTVSFYIYLGHLFSLGQHTAWYTMSAPYNCWMNILLIMLPFTVASAFSEKAGSLSLSFSDLGSTWTQAKSEHILLADCAGEALFEKWDVWGILPVRMLSPPLFTVEAIQGLWVTHHVFTQQTCECLLLAK